MKKASHERRERDQRESQGRHSDVESEGPRTAAETPGISMQPMEDASVGGDRTTHEANTVAEALSAPAG